MAGRVYPGSRAILSNHADRNPLRWVPIWVVMASGVAKDERWVSRIRSQAHSAWLSAVSFGLIASSSVLF